MLDYRSVDSRRFGAAMLLTMTIMASAPRLSECKSLNELLYPQNHQASAVMAAFAPALPVSRQFGMQHIGEVEISNYDEQASRLMASTQDSLGGPSWTPIQVPANTTSMISAAARMMAPARSASPSASQPRFVDQSGSSNSSTASNWPTPKHSASGSQHSDCLQAAKKPKSNDRLASSSANILASQKLELNRTKNRTSSSSGDDDSDDDNDDADYENDSPEPLAERRPSGANQTRARTNKANGDALQASGSVSLESALIPPSSNLDDSDDGRPYSDHRDGYSTRPNSASHEPHSSASIRDDQSEGQEGNQAEESEDNSPESSGQSKAAQDEEAAARREQEAAEASEAEAADRSALDEQQQAQREIILAQAQSEAKAIKEQQEALLRQQQLQQQILLRRHESDLSHHDDLRDRNKNKNRKAGYENGQPNDYPTPGKQKHSSSSINKPKRRQSDSYDQAHSRSTLYGDNQQAHGDRYTDSYARSPEYRKDDYSAPAAAADYRRRDYLSLRGQSQLDDYVDRQSRDRDMRSNLDAERYLQMLRNNNRDGPYGSDTNAGQFEPKGGKDSLQDEIDGDYSMRSNKQISSPVEAASNNHQSISLIDQTNKLNLTTSDLLEAAQHHYGAHYGSLQGHQGGGGHHGGGYYQYAESKKKGQFDSGFKRGNKKFSIAGHSSQHKGHANGHVKWHGKKGKGSHHWDLKHKNKGHYGGASSHYGMGFGGSGHSFY